jgi:hypothetical protein
MQSKTPEQLQREADMVDIKRRLREAMGRLPFDLNTAGATRVLAFKRAVDEARKLLKRNPADISPYQEALRNIEACAGARTAELAEQTYGTTTKGKR